MEGRITEEVVTKQILQWLQTNNWEIITFDFPQSGTGILLHPNTSSSKNADSFIPDIVAIKNENVVFFENKDKFVLSDFFKVEKLKNTEEYSDAISRLLERFTYTNIYYGVGMPYTSKNLTKTIENLSLVDFAVLMKDANNYELLNKAKELFI